MVDVEKLVAAIDETERRANACEGREWSPRFGPAPYSDEEPEHWVAGVPSCDTVAICGEDYTMARHHSAHIARNDPAAVLRRCAQDRLMVEAVQRHIEGHPGEHTNEEDPYDSCELCVEWNANALPERVLDYLARGYGISVEEETTQ